MLCDGLFGPWRSVWRMNDNYFIALNVLPNGDVPTCITMAAIIGRLHGVLAHHDRRDIGVSWPLGRGRYFGGVIRLHGTKAALTWLAGQMWLGALGDELAVSAIEAIPANARWVRYARVQPKRRTGSVVRRYARRHNCTEEEAAILYEKADDRLCHLPFLTLNSTSTRQDYRLYVHRQPDSPVNAGRHNHYGLTGAVPLF